MNKTQSNNGRRIKTKVTTFRMPEDRIKSLQDEAREKRLNTNALVNRIVETYIDYHKPASQANMMYLPKNVIRIMLEDVPEQTLDKAAKALNSEIGDFAYLRGIDTATISCLMH